MDTRQKRTGKTDATSGLSLVASSKSVEWTVILEAARAVSHIRVVVGSRWQLPECADLRAGQELLPAAPYSNRAAGQGW